jgi:elongation factor P
VIENTFNSGTKVTTARIERRAFQFLYKEDDSYIFMDQETFDQIPIEEKIIDNAMLIKEGQLVDILFHAETETPLTCELPAFIELEITYTEPGIKGDTATNTLKNATLETGAVISVPLFVEQGDKIKIDTRSNSYVERVKK